MKRILILSCIFLSAVTSYAKGEFHNESLQYVISYKWGLIHKDAGDAVLSLRSSGDNYDLMLTAKTKPWADKFYMVRDTLKGVVKKNNLIPVSYTKITRENGYYEVDDIRYSKSGNVTSGHCVSRRYKEDGVSEKKLDLKATGPVFDMLSVFYYLRALDYSRLNKNMVYKATIFSGSKSETISIRSLGISEVKMRNGSKEQAYHIKFKFTTQGGKKSSDDIDTWISTDSDHVPLYLVGKLPVGEVRVYLMKR